MEQEEQLVQPEPPSQPFDERGFVPMAHQDPVLTKWQLSGKDLISEIRQYLSGKKYDPKENKFMSVGIKLMNDKGIGAVSSIIAPYTSKNTFLTNLDEDYIREMILQKNVSINCLLATSGKNYEIHPEFMSLISEFLSDMIYFAIQRAWKEGERKFLRTTEQRRYVIQERPDVVRPERKRRWGLF